MSTTELPFTEFARRLCDAVHPFLSSTGARIPCGSHIAAAERLYPLTVTSPEGTQSLKVLLDARRENGLEVPS